MSFKYQIDKKDLIQHEKYHSFILCQTKNTQIAQKFPYHVTSLQGQLMNTQQKDNQTINLQYNYTIDCTNYSLNGKRLIISQGEWIKVLLTTCQKQIIQQNKYMLSWKQLKSLSDIQFYYYKKSQEQFIEITPTFYIKSQCIIFDQIRHISKLEFIQIKYKKPIQIQELNRNQLKKDNLMNKMNKLNPPKQQLNKQNQQLYKPNQQLYKQKEQLYKQRQYLHKKKQQSKKQKQKQNLFKQKQSFTFRCEYALMSDIHFFGSFVTGRKPICSYIKESNGTYTQLLDKQILKQLSLIYPSAQL